MLNTQGQMQQKETTTVWFRKSVSDERIFYCHVCKYPLFKYQGEVIMMVPGDANNAPPEGVEGSFANLKPIKAPFRHQCRGISKKYGKCPAEYLVEGFTT